MIGELIRQQAAQTNTGVEQALTADLPPRDVLVGIAANLLDLLVGDASLALNRAGMSSPQLAAVLLEHGRHTTGPRVERYLAQLQEKGVLAVADPAEAFRLLYGLTVQHPSPGTARRDTAEPDRTRPHGRRRGRPLSHAGRDPSRLTWPLGPEAGCAYGDSPLIQPGDFATRARLSPKALRPYADKGLLVPARLEERTGYRYYAVSQTRTGLPDRTAAPGRYAAGPRPRCSRPRPLPDQKARTRQSRSSSRQKDGSPSTPSMTSSTSPRPPSSGTLTRPYRPARSAAGDLPRYGHRRQRRPRRGRGVVRRVGRADRRSPRTDAACRHGSIHRLTRVQGEFPGVLDAYLRRRPLDRFEAMRVGGAEQQQSGSPELPESRSFAGDTRCLALGPIGRPTSGPGTVVTAALLRDVAGCGGPDARSYSSGQALLTQSWNPDQTSSVLVLPP